MNDPTGHVDPLGLDHWARVGNCDIHYKTLTTTDPDGTIHETVIVDFVSCDPGPVVVPDPVGGGDPGGHGGGGGFTLGLRTPGQTFSQCMQLNATTYSAAGITNLALGGNGKISDNTYVQAAAGNTFTSLYYSFAGDPNQRASNQVSTGLSAVPNVVTSGMGSTLTYGRRTADVMSLNLAGKGGLPQALSSSTGGVKGFITKASWYKAAADVGFTIAEALGCLGPR